METIQTGDAWDEATAQSYDADNADLSTPEVLDPMLDRLVALAEGGPVLELAIGTGRVAVPLAARGVSVSGIELSEPMVAQLRTKADEQQIPVVVGDMATARAPGAYALVYLVFNTISNLLEQAQQVACFANAAAHLRPGGRFVVELGVPDLRRLPPGQTAVVFDVDERHLGVDTYDVVAQRLTSHHVRFEPGRRARTFASTHRYAWPAELDLMAELAGLRLEHRWADWTGAPFIGESTSHVSVYRLDPAASDTAVTTG